MTTPRPLRQHDRAGRAGVAVLVVLAVGAALFAVPLHHLAAGLLVLAVLGLCVTWMVGATQLSGRILPWAIGLALFAGGWPLAISALAGVRARLGGVRVGAPSADTGLDGVLYDAETCAMLAGLMLAAAAVLLVAAKARAALPSPRPAPRPTARRRARVVEPGDDEPAMDEAAGEAPRAGGDDDDFHLLGEGDDDDGR
ncbi:hypothetical protein HY631_04495 [Candidatus Uhrbacteria bacterium]|nr:hypothetical protein [Candidatus Uhrbacteria bacterium]